MTQKGIVTELKNGKAIVMVDRISACDACENSATCAEKCKKVYATAENNLNARVGDAVEIETETGGVLLNAVLVFLVPIILGIGAYFCANAYLGEELAVLITFGVLVLSLTVNSFVLNRIALGKTVSRISRILDIPSSETGKN